MGLLGTGAKIGRIAVRRVISQSIVKVYAEVTCSSGQVDYNVTYCVDTLRTYLLVRTVDRFCK